LFWGGWGLLRFGVGFLCFRGGRRCRRRFGAREEGKTIGRKKHTDAKQKTKTKQTQPTQQKQTTGIADEDIVSMFEGNSNLFWAERFGREALGESFFSFFSS
jgi:hypothetical protein